MTRRTWRGRAGDEDPGGGLDLDEDPGDDPPPDMDPGELAGEAERITAEEAREAAVLAGAGLTAAVAADAAAAAGRRGPGMPGSARSVPGVYASGASGFASGKPLDTAPGCLVLGQFAEAAGAGDRYPGACDDELAGVICAWDRVEAHASSRKHAAVAELIRRRPAPGAGVQGPAQMPGASDEFVAQELASVLGESRAAAGDIVSVAQELEVSLPIPGESRPSAEGMAQVVCRRACFQHEGLPRKRRGTPGMAVTRESMNSRQARGGGSA